MTWDAFLSSYLTWLLETGWDWAPASASSPNNVARRWRLNTMATSIPATTTFIRNTSLETF